MSAVATKPRAKAAPSAPTMPLEASPLFWIASTKLALQTMFDLIDAAIDLELPEDDTSNYACRVLQVAHDLVLKEVENTDLAARSMARNEVANVAFDLFALLTAALNYPGEPLGATRIPFVKHARAIADQLGEFHCCGTEAADPRGAEMLPSLQHAIENARAHMMREPEGQAETAAIPPDAGESDPRTRIAEAVAVLFAAAREHGQADIWGVHSLAALIERTLESAAPEGADDLQEVSNLLEQVLAVIEKVNDQALDCMLLHAGTSLLTTAKQLVDDKCEAVS